MYYLYWCGCPAGRMRPEGRSLPTPQYFHPEDP